jgi:hypothetical protein
LTYGVVITLIAFPDFTPIALKDIRSNLHAGAESLMLGPFTVQKAELLRLVDWALADKHTHYCLGDAVVGDRITTRDGQTATVHKHDMGMGMVMLRTDAITEDQFLDPRLPVVIEPLTRSVETASFQFPRRMATAGRSVD